MEINIDILLNNVEMGKYIEAENIVGKAHLRRSDELARRGIKDFGTKQLPFKRFESNTAFFCIMLGVFNLFEAFKEDVSKDVIPKVGYATTFHRKIIDIAAKIAHSGDYIIFRVTEDTRKTLNVTMLWDLCNKVLVPAIL